MISLKTGIKINKNKLNESSSKNIYNINNFNFVPRN